MTKCKLFFNTLLILLLTALSINPATAATELKITAADGAANDYFGNSVSIDGTRMAVGAYYATVSGNNYQGAVYIYDFDGSNWIQTAKLTASDGEALDRFGYSVSLSGNRLAVGAWGADVSGNSNQGAAYVFDLSGGSWTQTTKLTASDGAANDRFSVVSLSGNRLAVGAGGADIGSNTDQGAAYIFDLSGGTWSETTKLTAADGAANDWFAGVSLSGNRLAVGAYFADVSGNSDQGAAYVFDLSGGSWSETTKLTAADGAANDRFGVVSLSGNRLAVGAGGADIGSNTDQGAAYIFDLSGGTWSETTKLTAADGAANDWFAGVSLSGNRLAVGAYATDVSGNSDQGAAYVFDLSGSSWSQTTKLVASDGASNDFFGLSVSLSGNRLAVGAWGADVSGNSDQGAVYVYSDTAASTYTIGGTVSGLSGSVTLQNNGGDDLTVNANGTFTFATSVASGGAYSVSVATQPTGQTCTVSNGSGTATANVTNVQVTCTTNTYTIGGNVSGLSGSVTLQNNGGDDLTVSTNGVFTFNTAIAHGSAYAVTVATQPTGQTCTVSNGSGTVNGANVTNVQVTCTTNSYTIGGNVSGLSGSVTLQNNGGDDLTVSTNGVFTFNTAIAHGSAYAVTVATQPTGQTCTVSNGSGTVNGANVTNVQVTCTTNTYTIGGNVSGLSGTVVLQNNGGDNLSVNANGTFTFATAIASGSAYAVTVATQPTGQTCTVSNGSGTATANVTNVQVTCAANTYTIGGTISGLSGTIVLQNNGGDDLTLSTDGPFTFLTALLDGTAYNITILTPPAGQSCTISNGSGTVNGGNIGNIQISCRATTVASVPTTNAYGILLMLLAMLGVAWFGVRRS